MYDLIIIGAGPAGISTALSAKELGLSYLLIERCRVLDTLHKYTLDKKVMDYPKDTPVRGPPEFHEKKAREIIDEWTEKARKCELVIEDVIDVKKEEDHFVVKTHVGEHRTKNVVIAIGIQGRHRCIGIPGEDQENVCHNRLPQLCFKDKNVIVVGGGDSALEAALEAEKTGGEVILSYRKPEFTRPKKENIESIKKSEIKVIFNSNVKSINKKRVLIRVGDEQTEHACDELIICAGTQSSKEFLERIGVEVKRKSDFTGEPQEVKPGMFVLGDLIGRPSIKMAVNQGSKVAEIIKKRKAD